MKISVQLTVIKISAETMSVSTCMVLQFPANRSLSSDKSGVPNTRFAVGWVGGWAIHCGRLLAGAVCQPIRVLAKACPLIYRNGEGLRCPRCGTNLHSVALCLGELEPFR